MAFEQIRLDRPLSRLELAVLVIVIAICVTWLLERLAYLEAVAEARSLDLSVQNIRTGIMVNVATRLLEGDNEGIASLSGANPVGTVIEPPPGYIGALRQANPAYIQPGQWYFDEEQESLVYRIVNVGYFAEPDGRPAQVRIKLKLNYDDANGNGAFDPGLDRPTGVSLQVLDPLNWKF